MHFERPYAHAHYLGTTTRRLGVRLVEHISGRANGSKLVAAVVAAGIPIRVARLWPGGDGLESRLKRRKTSPSLCPICRGQRSAVGARGSAPLGRVNAASETLHYGGPTVIVRYTRVDEFIAELRRRPPNVDGLVRCTLVVRPTELAPIALLIAEAGYLRVGRTEHGPVVIPIVLRAPCGELWPEEFEQRQNRAVRDRADAILDQVRAAAAALGPEVAGGRIEAGDDRG